MVNPRVLAGQKPEARLTMKNIGNRVAIETGDPEDYHLRVEGKSGEPPKTMWFRQLLREPGLPTLAVTVPAFPRDILPGESVDRTFELWAFYDLSAPGKYTVYLEARDGAGVWLRANAVPFEILAPAK
jgi:hypothetical protein